jgi:hypothetical protein
MNQYNYSQLISNKGVETVQWKRVLLVSNAGTIRESHAKERNCPFPYTKIKMNSVGNGGSCPSSQYLGH